MHLEKDMSMRWLGTVGSKGDGCLLVSYQELDMQGHSVQARMFYSPFRAVRPRVGWRPAEQSPLGSSRPKAAPPTTITTTTPACCDFLRCSGAGAIKSSSPPCSRTHFVHPRDWLTF